MNYAVVPEGGRHRRKVRRRLALAVIVCGVALVAAGAFLVVPSMVDEQRLDSLADSVVTEGGDAASADVSAAASSSAVTDDGETTADATTEAASGDGSFGVDWAALKAINSDVVGWIQVPSESIDFPVMQTDNNEYYLHHDIYGVYGYAGVFLDHRADADGQAMVIYGHTRSSGGMFAPLGTAYEQGTFDGIGTVLWSTPTSGTLGFTPVCSLTVTPDYAGDQQFSFTASDEDVAAQVSAAESDLLKRHAAKHEHNVVVPVGATVPGNPSMQVSATDVTSGMSAYWQLTDDEVAQCEKAGKEAADDVPYQAYLAQLLADSSASRDDAAALMQSSHRTLILACCTWPFNSHRTLVVCVR